jgi:carboxylesterase type B
MSMRRRGLAIAVVAAGALAAAVPAQARTQRAEQAQGPLVVQTDRGAVQGFHSASGVDAWLGIRYAAPPVGEGRWRPPQPAAPWSGVQDATRFGNTCPATASTNGPRSETEDCLFVNVWRPSNLRPRRSRPVYVFIHGGGLTNGSSNQADMTAIVRRTGAVGVSFNYRLGVFGFLSVPGLTAEAGESGNYGLMDQQAALRWVRENIAAFGGRPGAVTVGGESAGGWSVCTHLVAPGSRGLYERAMIQSGSCPSRSQPEAEASGTTFAAQVGCADAATQVACLRAAPAGTLIDAFPGPSLPVRGTAFLPRDPRQAVAEGDFEQVPLVIGANRDEGRTFAQGFIGATQEQYVAWVRETFATNADAVLARYPWPAQADRFTPAYLIGAIMTDAGLVAGIGGCPNLALTQDFARFTRTYAYEFAHRTGPGLTPIPGYVWGAGHAIELAYLFPSFNNGVPITPMFDAGERQLAREMKSRWGAFARYGTPDAAGLRRWPAYEPGGRVLSLRAGGQSRAVREQRIRREHQCGFWWTLPAPAPGA